MAWTGLTLTVDGRNALNQAQQANTMNIKSVVIGDGAAPSNYNTRKELVHQLYELTELKIDMTNTGCNITADLPKVDYDYYFREIGVIVTTDDHDVLYVYDNCGEDAQYIINSTGVEENQKRIRLSLVISDVSHITVSTPSMLYVAYDEFESKVNDLQDKKLDADGDASDAYVNFTYVKDLEKLVKGDKFSRAFGKIARAISDLMDHIKTVATSTIAGHVKLSNSSAITEAGQYALDAVEKNASVEGSLANQISEINRKWKLLSASSSTSTYAQITIPENISELRITVTIMNEIFTLNPVVKTLNRETAHIRTGMSYDGKTSMINVNWNKNARTLQLLSAIYLGTDYAKTNSCGLYVECR